MTTFATTSDPWQPYDDSPDDFSANKHKNPVPEPATYGLIFSALTLVVLFWGKRYLARKFGVKGCGCGGCGGGDHDASHRH